VSQSPQTANASSEQVDRYVQGWKALSELIGQGRSFSGYERNKCFLNTRDGQFADVSAVTGLDLADDARAVAVTDWNFDGQQDLWIANRTAPRVRLLRNTTPRSKAASWLAIRLRGIQCNRDAIGARVVVHLPGDVIRSKSLHAGDGYLSQSSKWLHFGLGEASTVERVEVFWPGGEREVIAGVQPRRYQTITQGTGKAKHWRPDVTDNRLTASALPTPKTERATRTWIIGRLPLPRLDVIPAKLESPLLVSLWSTTCRPCLAEMAQWTAHEDEIRAAGLDILALNVDGLADRGAARAPPGDFPFSGAEATTEAVEAMELLHRSFVELQKPLPVPTSFLLDTQGRVAAIYKGPVELATLLEDVALLPQPLSVQRDAAVPFAGRWTSLPFPPQPLRYAQALGTIDPKLRESYLWDYAGRPEIASPGVRAKVQSYLGEEWIAQGRFPEAVEAFSLLFQSAADRPSLHRRAGVLLMKNNLALPAVKHLRLALRGYQNDSAFRFNLGIAEAATGNAQRALDSFRAVIALDPKDAAPHFQIGNILQGTRRGREAIAYYRQALRLKPGWWMPANNLAWLLATHPDASVRNADESYRLAKAVTDADHAHDPNTLSTLAAALAEQGNFESAVRVATQAVQIAGKSGNQAQVDRLEAALRKYRASEPWRSR
jgi:Flp pilus assembly protein TadD